MKSNISKQTSFKYAMGEAHVMTLFVLSEKELSDEWINSTFAKYKEILKPDEEHPVLLTIKVLSNDINVMSTPGHSLRLVEAIEMA